MSDRFQDHLLFQEPRLSFGPSTSSDLDIHPLRGLLKFGPYSEAVFPDAVRIATISPTGDEARLFSFMRELKTRYQAGERKGYLQDWPGFEEVFRTKLEAAPKECLFSLDESLDTQLQTSNDPGLLLADSIKRAIQLQTVNRSAFDVIFIFLPKKWMGFSKNIDTDFDLHDELKAFTALMGIPIQIVREDSALTYGDRASVMWRIGLAIYAKAGGIPWKLAGLDSDTAYIGISYAMRSNANESGRYVTCCSQVFDNHGTGLEFIAYNADDVRVFRSNPFLSRSQMFRVMTRCIDLYRRRHAGAVPKNIVVHKNTEFRKDEIDGCLAALHLCDNVDLIQIVENVGWRGVNYETKNGPAMYPIERGTLLGISEREALLWIHGNLKGIDPKRPYFQGGKSTPQPIKLVRHAGRGSWDSTALATLALSKMNWNNDAVYDTIPVTLKYSQVLANVIKRMPGLENGEYQFRFFI